MRKQTEKRLIIICVTIAVILIIASFFTEGTPVKKYDALKPKAKDEKKWEYALADANVRRGPGTQYQIVSKLKIFDQVVIVDEDTSGWEKIEFPATGYVQSILIGNETEAKLKYVERFERDINDMHRKGIILSADRGHFCVNRDKWNKVEPDKNDSRSIIDTLRSRL